MKLQFKHYALLGLTIAVAMFVALEATKQYNEKQIEEN